MSTYENDRSPLSTLITWVLMALLAVAALKLAFWLIGVVTSLAGALLGIAFSLLFTFGPILLVGWLVLKLIRWLGRRPEDDAPIHDPAI